ncbi:MAG TPA: sulfatase [Bryobacteraceae bacterium]|nr:sulfatase [Bryobacteraceae bacterium]
MMIQSRREFLASAAAVGSAWAAPSKPKQNVLMIAIDDLNDWIGCLGGHPDVKTPNLDRLAARGTLFTKAYCAAPVCNPSRTSLMTGIRPSSSGVYENQQPFRRSDALKDAVTLSQHFMANGYRAVGGGKIYHTAFPDPASWNEYFPSQNKNKPADPMPDGRPLNGIPKTAHFDWGPVNAPDSEMGDHKVVDWAAGELKKPRDKPFFLACGIYRPHLPWFVPKKYFDLYPLEKITLPQVKEDDLDDVPAPGKHLALRSGDHKKVMEHHQWRNAVQGYLASISFCDAQVGRLLDAFDASPHAHNTTIVLWSDHGWHLGQKLHWRKFALWEEATHNVFMVVAPGVTKAGAKCARTVSLLDVYPTLVELCGLPPKKGLEGVSLMPLLKNPQARWDRPAVTTYERGNHSVRSERWRYIRYHDGSEELYDHGKDDLEWTNLAGNAELAGVKQDLRKWLPAVDALDSPKEKGVGEE